MGCGASENEKSSDSQEVPEHLMATQMAMKGMKTSETIYQAYKRLDQQICKLESTCSGPRLQTAEAWIEFLETDKQRRKNSSGNTTWAEKSRDLSRGGTTTNPCSRFLEDRDENGMLDFRINEDTMNLEKLSVQKVGQLALQCDVAFNIEKAAKNEEFLASVSKDYMNRKEAYLVDDIIEHAKKRAKTLAENFNGLRILYAEHDGLLASASSGSYTSMLEQKLDDQLEQSRQIRDKIGAIAEQWHTSANLLRTSAKSAILAMEYWTLVEASRNAHEKILQALDCRNAVVESIVALEYSQKALPQVDFNHITPRQISAVKHANLYLLTDMANPVRYKHTKRVLESFQNNVNLAVTWLFDTFNKSLKKDLNHSEDNVVTIAKQLRQERLEYFAKTIGTKLYVPAAVVNE